MFRDIGLRIYVIELNVFKIVFLYYGKIELLYAKFLGNIFVCSGFF